MPNVLVTGANGFVGAQLVSRLEHDDRFRVRKARRDADQCDERSIDVGDIGPETDWSSALAGTDVVVHCAARVHVMNDSSADPLAAFRKVNLHGTLNLARQAVAAGVRRFVFVSSVKVNGETTTNLPPFTSLSAPAPVDAYGKSKWEAEQGLWTIARETGLDVVIVRPPLVYGPGVKANFLRLMKAVRKGLPLPLARVRNQRSMVYVGNLVDLLSICTMHPDAVSQTFLVSDGVDLSTQDLVKQLAMAMHIKPRLIGVPPSLMLAAAHMVGKSDVADRLLGSLQVDMTLTRNTLGWQPPYSIECGIAATVNGYVLR
jgi:nucleoside-diphosphate-sugar epimerase